MHAAGPCLHMRPVAGSDPPGPHFRTADGHTIKASASAHGPCTCANPLQLVIAYHMNAASMGEFSRSEFHAGLLKMGTDSLEKLRRKVPELRGEMARPDRFHDIYNYAYMFSREVRRRRCCSCCFYFCCCC